MNQHPDVRIALVCSYIAERLERARQEELRRSAPSIDSKRQKAKRRRIMRRARVPQEAA
jgi:hypothetical protein